MSEFFSQFLSFLIFSPLTAAVFGVGIWILPAVLLRGRLRRLRLRFFHFFVSGYVFIAIMTLYLLIVGVDRDGGRHHEAGPFVGMVVSLVLAWLAQRLLRSRVPRLGRRDGQAAPAQPPYGAAPYGHPGYGQAYGPPPVPGYPAPHPGYPPGFPPPAPPAPSAGIPGEGAPAQRTPGVPWTVPPPDPGA